MRNVVKIKMGVTFNVTSYRVWVPKGAFWALKNSIFFKSGQICREDSKSPDVHFLREWLFLCDSKFLRYDWFCNFFSRTEQKFEEKKNWVGGFTPSHHPGVLAPRPRMLLDWHPSRSRLASTVYFAKERYVVPYHAKLKSQVAVNYCKVQNRQ